MAESDTWVEIDAYISDLVVKPDAALEQALTQTAAAGLPAIAVSAAQGKQLHLLVKMMGARHVLEIGTLGGYSTIWMTRALPAGGKLISLEIDPKHAEVARANLSAAGIGAEAEVIVGPALDTLPKLEGRIEGGFDFAFIDADKANIPTYFEWAVKLSHPGGVIVVDNVVRGGKLADAASSDESVIGVRRLHDLIAERADVSATTIQTVGAKGYDGFTLALIN